MIEERRYRIKADKVEAEVEIRRSPEEFVPVYFLRAPEIEPGTMALMERIREKLLAEITVKTTELLDPRAMEELKKRFYEKAVELIKRELPGASERVCEFIAGTLIHEMVGLGKLELLIADGNLEEIVINNCQEPVWVFHKKYGWLKTNIIVPSEAQIENYASIVGRKVGRQITILNPLMDAHLTTGDRVNATLFPISTKGNTLTIRKFRRKPWVITDLIENKTLNLEVAALLWSAVEYEINIIVSGGTASGKSVSADTMVFTSYCGIEEIGKLYEEFKERYGEKKLDKVYTIVDIPPKFRFFVQSLNKEGEVELKPVSRIWKKRSYPEIFELKLENGTLIRTTPEHPFFVFDGREIKKVRTDSLREGDYIVSSRINPFNENRIDVFSELKKKPKIVKHRFLIKVDSSTKRKFINSFISKFGCWKRLRKLHYSEETIKKLLKKNFIPYELLEKTNVYPENINKVGWLKSSVFIKVPKLDYNFGRLLGLICGDGTLAIRKCGKASSLEITNEKGDLKREFVQLIKNCFGLDEVTVTSKASNRVAISLRSIIRFLSEIIGIPINDKVSNWSVPKVVAKGSKEVIFGFLSGLIDTDGNTEKGRIEIVTKSETAAKQLPYLFQLFGAITRVSEKFVKNKKYYRICVRELDEIVKFVKTKYKKILDGKTFAIVPIDGNKLKEILTKLYKKLKNVSRYEVFRTYWSNSISKKRSPSIESLRDILNLIENHPEFNNLSSQEKQIVKNWKLLVDKKIVLFKIEKISKIKSKGEWLYDFSVEDTHNFLAGNFGCCFVSNTTFLNVLMSFIPPNQRIVSIEDSVSGDEEIFVKTLKGLERVKIKEFVDGKIDGSFAVTLDGSEVYLCDKFQIFSVNEGHVKQKEPKYLIRHYIKKPMFDITLASGRKIKTTGDHSLFSLGENLSLKSVKVSEIKKGDFVATLRKAQLFGELEGLDLTEYLTHLKGLFVRGEVLKNILEEKQMRKFLIKNIPTRLRSKRKYYREKGILPVNLFEKMIKIRNLTEEEKKGLVLTSRIGSSFLPLKLKIEKELALLFGYWLADGSYDKNSIIISEPEKELEELFKNYLAKFSMNVKPHSDKYSFMINSSVLKKLFVALGFVGDAYTKRVPELVFNFKKELQAEVLKGIFSGDSWVRKSEVAISLSSLDMLRDIQTLLLNFEINFRYSNKRGKDKTYLGRISGKKFLEKFYSQIGFFQSHKSEKLKKVISSIKKVKDRSDVIPLPKWVYQEIKKYLKSHYSYTTWKSWCSWYKRSNIGREHLKELIVLMPENGLKRRLVELCNDDIFWDRIVDIKKEDFEGYVYDFSVPNVENFVCNNVIAHNTRELALPSFLHWVPLTTRAPNPEGIGGVDMLDLMVNSLRMRPDRIIVGEIRRQDQAEVLFEAMHTGHSVYATLHADTAEQTYRRLINPPINVPETMLEALHLIVAMFRDRRRGIRRIFQVAEVVPVEAKEAKVMINTLYRWKPFEDEVVKQEKSLRLMDELKLHTGMTDQEFEADINDKKKILSWMLANRIRTVDGVGKVVCEYYYDPEKVLDIVEKNKAPTSLVPKSLLVETE